MGPSIPNPADAAIKGTQAQAELYPFSYLIDALSQTGGAGQLIDPVTGQPRTYDFTGLGTADVQNKMSDQMAKTLLDIQKGLGPQFIAQRLKDLQQADPNGYASRQQLFDKILQDSKSDAPDLKLANDTQKAIQAELDKGATLDPEETKQVQNQVRGGQVGRGIYLGNAPIQQESDALVNAGDAMQGQREKAASDFLASGTDPADIQYRKIQQDLANFGAFLGGQTPTAQFGSLSGAQTGAAPNPATGYQTPGFNLGQSMGQGVNNAFDLYNLNSQQANPFAAGLSGASTLASGAFNLGYNPWANSPTSGSSPQVPLGAGGSQSNYPSNW